MSSKKSISIKKLIVIIIAVVILSIGIGFVIGFFSARSIKSKNEKYYESLIEDIDKDGMKELLKIVDLEKVKANFK